jgi:hypothetical protein
LVVQAGLPDDFSTIFLAALVDDLKSNIQVCETRQFITGGGGQKKSSKVLTACYGWRGPKKIKQGFDSLPTRRQLLLFSVAL